MKSTYIKLMIKRLSEKKKISEMNQSQRTCFECLSTEINGIRAVASRKTYRSWNEEARKIVELENKDGQ